MTIKRILFLVFLVLASCREKELDLNISYPGDKLVLWSKLQAGLPIRIQVTKTFNPVGKIPDDITVTDASVAIYKDGKAYLSLSQSSKENGVYISDSLIQAGSTYVVKVFSPSLPTAESFPVTVPADLPDLTILRTRKVPGEINYNSPQDLISLYFTKADRLNEKFFAFKFMSYYPKDTASSKPYGTADNIPANEEDCHTWAEEKRSAYSTLLNQTFNRTDMVFLMTNKCLPESNVPLKFFVETGKVPTSGDTTWAQKLTLRIGSVTRESFEYAKIEYEQPEGIDHLVLPSKKTLTNIKNGYGLIFGSNEKTIEVR